MRAKLGLTTDQALADALFLSQPQVGRVMKGENGPGPKFIAAAVMLGEQRGFTFNDLFAVRGYGRTA